MNIRKYVNYHALHVVSVTVVCGQVKWLSLSGSYIVQFCTSPHQHNDTPLATQAKRHPARDTGETSNNGTETLAHVAHGAFGFQPSLGKQQRVESSTEANKDWLVTKFYSPHIFLETYLYPKNNEIL